MKKERSENFSAQKEKIMPTTEKPGLTRDAIKYLAIFTMLLNHIANVLLPENTILWEVFIDIGYFTAITMCYFLVEGFYYTHSRRKYGERLLIFAGISQSEQTDSKRSRIRSGILHLLAIIFS